MARASLARWRPARAGREVAEMVTVRRGQSFVVGPDFGAEEEAGAFVVDEDGETIEASEFRIEIGPEELFAMRPPYRAGWEEVGVLPSGVEVDVDYPAWRCEGGRELLIQRAAGDENPAIVYYPSARGGEGAEPRRGPFPVIGFAHGHRYPCSADFLCEERPRDEEADATEIGQDYKQWGHILRALASWGFVVVAPDLHWIIRATTQPWRRWRVAAVDAAIQWLRNSWPRGDIVSGRRDRTGLLGHSFGGQVVLELGSQLGVAAVGLVSPQLWADGVFVRAELLDQLGDARAAVLLMIGTQDFVPVDWVQRVFDDEAGRPKYRVELGGGNHWGYTESILECEGGARGPVEVLAAADATVAEQQAAQRELATHFVVMFFRKHLLGAPIPDDLLNAELVESRPDAQAPTLEGET